MNIVLNDLFALFILVYSYKSQEINLKPAIETEKKTLQTHYTV
jgi:hypothetical protein